MVNQREFYKKLLMVALPIAFQSLIVSSLNMFDTVIVGNLGEKAVASVGIANQLFFLLSLIFFGIGGGCSIYLSQFWGKEDRENIKKIIGTGIVTVSAVALIFTIIALTFPKIIVTIFSRDVEVVNLAASYLRIVSLSYGVTGISVILSSSLRCMEKTLVPMVISFFAVVLNIILNYILVFGKFGFVALGVDGSAVATLIARIFECIAILYVSLNKGSILHGRVKEFFDFNKKFYFNIIKDVFPVVINETCWALGTVSYSIAYGFIGTSAQASAQICNTVQNLFMVITFGIANGSLVMIGNAIGSGNEKKAKAYAGEFCIISIFIGIILGITMTGSAPFIMKLFKVSSDVIKDSINILIVMSISAPFKVFNIVTIVGLLRGGGDVKAAMYIEVFTMWCIGVPMAFLGALIFRLPIHLVVTLICFEEAVKFVFCLTRLKSNKWIRNVINNV